MFFLIDKPEGITSFDILRKLRKKLNTRKMWHTWTLDPLATWLVLVAVWWYTKLIRYLEKENKVYTFTVWLDWETDSFDSETDIRYISDEKKQYYKKELTKQYLEELIQKNFSWKIKQMPPKYSALKVWWKKALNMVRAWEEFSLKEREVTIEYIKVLSFSYPDIEIEAKVTAWTYIRSIANDLWKIIWSGWYIKKLRRIKLWELDLSQSQELDKFDENGFIDVKWLFKKERFIELNEDILKKMNNWMEYRWKLDYIIWEDLFVEFEGNITNIVNYDSEILKPIRKI